MNIDKLNGALAQANKAYAELARLNEMLKGLIETSPDPYATSYTRSPNFIQNVTRIHPEADDAA